MPKMLTFPRTWIWLALACCVFLIAGVSIALPSRSPAPAARPAVAAPVAATEPVQALPPTSTPQPTLAAAPAKGTSGFDLRVDGILELDQPLKPGDYAWNDEGVPAGPLKIVVDIAMQRLHVFRSGQEIGQASIIYGADDKPTPMGVYPILEKDADHVSNLYDAPMPYMLRLTWDGIAIHGSEVEDGSATHGCIGIPEDFAQILFAQAKLGDQVLITNGAPAALTAATSSL